VSYLTGLTRDQQLLAQSWLWTRDRIGIADLPKASVCSKDLQQQQVLALQEKMGQQMVADGGDGLLVLHL